MSFFFFFHLFPFNVKEYTNEAFGRGRASRILLNRVLFSWGTVVQGRRRSFMACAGAVGLAQACVGWKSACPRRNADGWQEWQSGLHTQSANILLFTSLIHHGCSYLSVCSDGMEVSTALCICAFCTAALQWEKACEPSVSTEKAAEMHLALSLVLIVIRMYCHLLKVKICSVCFMKSFKNLRTWKVGISFCPF